MADYDRNIQTYCYIHCVALNRCASATNMIQISHWHCLTGNRQVSWAEFCNHFVMKVILWR